MKHVLRRPIAIFAISLLIGIALLLLISRFVNIATTFYIVQKNLTTPRGIVLALLSGVAFLLAFSVRGIRWKLFLSSISTISTGKAIRLFLVSGFINFLLPISGGEIAKTLMLKRIAGIPISRSLPTVAMDRSLDLLPAFVIMAIVPFLGVQMDIRLWLVLCAVGGLLIVLTCFIGLTVWKHTAAIAILHSITNRLPRAIGSKMEAFATGFVDSLLAGASRPHIFLPAVALTCLAVTCDSLFAMFAFWAIGLPISFGTMIFGYTIYNLFFIFPTPPGQIGSNEAVGLLVFTGLLHLPTDKVAAMFIFSHPWTALLMTTSGLICLKTLGLTITDIIKMKRLTKENNAENEGAFLPELRKDKLPVLPL
jgi:uncharacterized protein (TIRG00374 family)